MCGECPEITDSNKPVEAVLVGLEGVALGSEFAITILSKNMLCESKYGLRKVVIRVEADSIVLQECRFGNCQNGHLYWEIHNGTFQTLVWPSNSRFAEINAGIEILVQMSTV